ncbi:hypothetical protein HJG60_011810 [Phyllostomus discolor]|uniref:Uncharacterized protein n=1 Tax=Phyllostomus discolor TaxID=89673 RepID=A0A833ZNN6_9CHIR|nr:hypothetical protein HJG60_011810 [Phyllostomus discolor]
MHSPLPALAGHGPLLQNLGPAFGSFRTLSSISSAELASTSVLFAILDPEICSLLCHPLHSLQEMGLRTLQPSIHHRQWSAVLNISRSCLDQYVFKSTHILSQVAHQNFVPTCQCHIIYATKHRIVHPKKKS